jgi:hypothetical protein
MRVLLDEHLDRRLKREFGEGFVVATVTERGWNGKDNGNISEPPKKILTPSSRWTRASRTSRT